MSRTLKIHALPPLAPNSIQYKRVGDYDTRKRETVRPFLKCAGGKLRLVHEVLKLTPDTFDRYVEVFTGGGAVFFAMASLGYLEGKEVILNDADVALMEAYQAIQELNPELIGKLEHHAKQYNEVNGHLHYYNLRDSYNLGNKDVDLYLFLRKVCFNGMWRIDSNSGKMVTLCGNYQTAVFDFDRYRECQAMLEGVTLRSASFESMDRHVLAGDLIYCDPPYDGLFTDYIQAGFSDDNQVELVKLCAKWSDQGATVIYSNNDTPNVRKWLSDLWSDSTCFRVHAYSQIGGIDQRRKNRPELMVVGGPK